MPNLKDHRGTVLYAALDYTLAAGGGGTIVAGVFNQGIGAVQADRFLMDDNTPKPFVDVFPDMVDATVQSVGLSVSYPDGTLATVSAIPLGDVVLVGWSEVQHLAVDPTIDPDWHQNRTYIRVIATS